MSLDEIWLRDVDEQVEDVFEFYRVTEAIINEELMLMPDKSIVVEGAALLPEYRKAEDNYICIIPTPDFQTTMYKKRTWVSVYLKGCSDPTLAFSNWMDRDMKFAEIVLKRSIDLHQKSIVTDGEKSIAEMYRLVKESFNL